MFSTEIKGLLLRQEGYDVEFKQNVNAVEQDDIVAFANSENGGVIIVGVSEGTDDSGRQSGQLTGYIINDKDRQKLISKADSCIPPVSIEIETQEQDSIELCIVRIPGGKDKPYCTGGGTYKIRIDNRNAAIKPTMLLDMFIRKEGGSFVDKYKAATEELNNQIAKTRENLVSMEYDLGRELNHVFDMASKANALSGEAMNYSREAYGRVEDIEDQVKQIKSILLEIRSSMNKG